MPVDKSTQSDLGDGGAASTLPAKSAETLTEVQAGFRRLGIEWPRFTGWQWKVLIVLTLINLLNYFDRLIINPMFPFLKQEFGVSDSRLGLLASAVILVHSLSVLPFGFWSDRGPRQKIMAFGVFIWSVATALSGIATTFRSLLLARGVVGVGEGRQLLRLHQPGAVGEVGLGDGKHPRFQNLPVAEAGEDPDRKSVV